MEIKLTTLRDRASTSPSSKAWVARAVLFKASLGRIIDEIGLAAFKAELGLPAE